MMQGRVRALLKFEEINLSLTNEVEMLRKKLEEERGRTHVSSSEASKTQHDLELFRQGWEAERDSLRCVSRPLLQQAGDFWIASLWRSCLRSRSSRSVVRARARPGLQDIGAGDWPEQPAAEDAGPLFSLPFPCASTAFHCHFLVLPLPFLVSSLPFHCLSLCFHYLSLCLHCLSTAFHCHSLCFHYLSMCFRDRSSHRRCVWPGCWRPRLPC